MFATPTDIKFRSVSTVAEIESAIEKLPAGELHRLLDRLYAKSTSGFGKSKTGAELAKLWSVRYHLPPAGAEALAGDLNVFWRGSL